jgi:hypothetical protein
LKLEFGNAKKKWKRLKKTMVERNQLLGELQFTIDEDLFFVSFHDLSLISILVILFLSLNL